jgi:hypothetical protein
MRFADASQHYVVSITGYMRHSLMGSSCDSAERLVPGPRGNSITLRVIYSR